jgi:hypothetical protein
MQAFKKLLGSNFRLCWINILRLHTVYFGKFLYFNQVVTLLLGFTGRFQYPYMDTGILGAFITFSLIKLNSHPAVQCNMV